MIADDMDMRILAAAAEGLSLERRPYARIAVESGTTEADVGRRLEAMVRKGVIKRLGVVVRHHELGFGANAMVVWDVPDAAVAQVGRRIAAFPFVTLCYRRPRRPPIWPYNLFCMIHGKDRESVDAQIAHLNREVDLGGMRQAALFSRRRFKQRGARYGEIEAARGAA